MRNRGERQTERNKQRERTNMYTHKLGYNRIKINVSIIQRSKAENLVDKSARGK